MTIRDMLDLAKVRGRVEHDRYLVVVSGDEEEDEVASVYKDGRLLIRVEDVKVTAFQAWTSNEAILINEVLNELRLTRYHCTWSSAGAHLVEYTMRGDVLHSDAPAELMRRLYVKDA